uniref:uncharacterized protein LOC120335424 n=1 Tax=Styela clava TaxID=7725 RepID=UPI00193ACC12|nr:uncharacterized protein LOC120335424 [Styela clava]
MLKLVEMPFARKYIKEQIRKPSSGFWGFIARKSLLKGNSTIEIDVARATNAGADENVLEIGFGLGDGLEYVLQNTIRNGKGSLYGVDYSEDVCKWARKSLKKDVASGKLTILNEDVAKMSIPDATIHKVFHVHCFYFWPSLANSINEIKRIMKPGGLMIAGMHPEKLEMVKDKGLLESWMFEPKRYINALQEAGFENIKEKNMYNGEVKSDFKLIFGTKPDD